MTRTIVTHNHYALGDNLCSLHLIRALSRLNPEIKFWHFAHGKHLPQLAEMTQDMPNIDLFSFDSQQWEKEGQRSLDLWKNVGATDAWNIGKEPYKKGLWEKSQKRWDWSAYMLENHDYNARRMGLKSPFSIREQLLFDYPSLGDHPNPKFQQEFLFVNSNPNSGQLKPMHGLDSGYLDELIWQLGKKHSVITTHPAKGALCTQSYGHSVNNVGKLSVTCRHHIMVATGPMWPTLNVHNHHWHEGRRRIVLLDNGERLNLPHIEQVATVDEVFAIAKQEGWL